MCRFRGKERPLRVNEQERSGILVIGWLLSGKGPDDGEVGNSLQYFFI